MKVSVVIPLYNKEAFVGQTIGSVLEQSHPADEVIVVDDGSDDRSAEIAQSFGDPVEVVVRRCGGASSTRNFGVSLASGDALMFLDADDVLGPDALKHLVAGLEKHSSGIAACPWFRLDQVKGEWVKRPASCTPLPPEYDYLGGWLTGWYHPPCSVLWSREAYLKTGGWDQRVPVNNDGDIMMRALVQGTPLHRIKRGAAFYRRLPDEYPTSVSGARFTRKGRKSQIYVVRKIARMLEERRRLGEYHEPIAEAFESIATECQDEYPDLYKRCKRLAHRFGYAHQGVRDLGVKWYRHKARPLINKIRQKLGSIKNTITPADYGEREQPKEPKRKSKNSNREIRFGFSTCREALATGVKTPCLNPSVPTVTVIIPTYNRDHVLGRAVESVLDQSYEDFEVLVVDDGSDDDTEQVVGQYEDSRIRYLQQPENLGVSAARNRGLREARGEFVAFLDSDDEWFSTKLEEQIGLFQDAPDDLGLVYCGVETVDGGGGAWTFRPEHRGNVYEDLLLNNVIHSGSGVVIRRNVIRSAGFFDEEIPAIEDYDYWLRVARYYEADYIEKPLVRYFDVTEYNRKSLADDENLEARQYFFEKHRREMRRAGTAYEFLIESTRRHLDPRFCDDPPDLEGARKEVRRAVKENPLSLEEYRLKLRLLLPRVYGVLKRLAGLKRHIIRSG